MIAIAIDDEPPALGIIEKLSQNVSYLELKKTFTNPHEALKYLKNYPVDLIFLDIHMPGINGIDFYKKLANKPLVIFTTAFAEYAVEGFNVNAIDYLLKPFSRERFETATQKAFGNYKKTLADDSEKTLVLRSNYSLINVQIDEILLVESLDDYITVYLSSGKNIVVRMTLKTIIEKLPPQFVRVHRSYIVPLQHITSVRNKVISTTLKEIPIGIKYEKDFFEVYKNQ